VTLAPRYENFIGGKWQAPTKGHYRFDVSPATGNPITEVAHSTPEDVELALDAAHAAKDAWGEASATERAGVPLAIADRIERHQEMLAVVESWENGKPVRETLAADIPLVVDHFRYFAAAARSEEGRTTEIDKDLIPSTVELGGKSPNIFFSDAMAHDDDFLDKAVEGFVLYTFNKGEVCTCPSRALIQADIYDEFMARCLHRIAAIRQGNPLDTDTQLGPQVSAAQLEKITSYLAIGHNEGAEVLTGGQRAHIDGEFAEGYYFQPTVLKGDNKMRVFQEEIFGPVLAVTTFTDDADALTIADDPLRPAAR
jgi:acyl-CoA reductase-like NAD-dependent aldehyde dehydrogenase